MSVSFKKMFGFKKSVEQASVLTSAPVAANAEQGKVINAGAKAEEVETAKHGGDVCCGSCSK